ncbi:unnamed protein product [Parnassius apollo]|uniref:(apollo) hypothetical protein n=1 Tax=Parnassius apollo TaxID=110799 RepID=A0A8S3X5H2_PARAO|nr:unnamed protein product [Parnassius apollo]
MVSLAESPELPPPRCGIIPKNIYSCMGNPRVVKFDVSNKCGASDTQCDRMTCLFRESGFMNGDKVDTKKLIEHFNEYKKQSPEWTSAVDQLQTSCITNNLPPQGIYINCPAYDVMMCALTSFIRNVQPSQWSTDPSCARARQYATHCPVCPNDCFSRLIPTGTCNSCQLLPRSP